MESGPSGVSGPTHLGNVGVAELAAALRPHPTLQGPGRALTRGSGT